MATHDDPSGRDTDAPRTRTARTIPRSMWIGLALVFLGAAARLWGYLTASALWLDELLIVGDLRDRSFAELLQPLPPGHNAPIGWLLVTKAVTVLFGDTERALRAGPFLASLVTLPLGWAVARRAVGPRDALYPLAVISFSPWIIWQGIQAKQYASDLLVALILFALALGANRGPLRHLVTLALVGLLTIWFSMPSIFVLAAVGLVLLVQTLRRRPADVRRLTVVVTMGGLWGVAFAVNLVFFLRPTSQVAWLREYWASGFQPWPISTAADLAWPLVALARAMEAPTGFLWIGALAVVPVLIGMTALPSRRFSGDRFSASVAALSILVTLLAGIWQCYPFADRLILFLVPSLMILFTVGVRLLAAAVPRMSRMILAGTGVLCLVPVGLCLVWLPYGGLPMSARSDVLMERLAEVHQAGETVLIEHIATHAWSYYGVDGTQPIALPPAWNPRERREAVVASLRAQKGPVVWLVMTEVTDRPDQTHRQAPGHARASERSTGAATYRWLVSRMTSWAELSALRSALPRSWEIREEFSVQGGSLWRLERR